MTTENHTPGALRIGIYPTTLVSDTKGPGVPGYDSPAYGGYLVAESVHNANARRLAACWNACQGVDTDLLEQNPAPFSTMRAELDTALAAVATGKRLLLEEMERASTRGEQVLAAEQQRDALLAAAKVLLDGADAAAKANAVSGNWWHNGRAMARRAIAAAEAAKNAGGPT